MPFVLGLCDPVLVLARGQTICERHARRGPARSRSARRLPRRGLPSRAAGGRLMMLKLTGRVRGLRRRRRAPGRRPRRATRARSPASSARTAPASRPSCAPSAACSSRARATSSSTASRSCGLHPARHPRAGGRPGAAVERALPEPHRARERADGRLHPASRQSCSRSATTQVAELFPVVARARATRSAGNLSGGQRRMVEFGAR